jgi:hypothetical protein
VAPGITTVLRASTLVHLHVPLKKSAADHLSSHQGMSLGDHHQAASRKSGADHLSWPHITKSVQKNQPQRTLNPSSLNLAMIYLAHACITANGAHSSPLRPSLCRIHLSAPSQRLTDGFLQVPATSGSHLLLNCGRANPRTPFYLGKTPKIDLSTF